MDRRKEEEKEANLALPYMVVEDRQGCGENKNHPFYSLCEGFGKTTG